MASPHRIEILELLAQGERTVESLATETGLSVADTSRHLQQLRQAQLALARRDGLFVHYRLAGPEVVGLVLALRQAGSSTSPRSTASCATSLVSAPTSSQ
jgi:DNA-binding transcriptional ArsR family regulator